MSTQKENIKYMVIVRGKGTKKEVRIITDVKMYWSETLKAWVTVPESSK